MNDIDKIINRIGVQMLPSKEIDCFFIQLPDDDSVFRMIFDCGSYNQNGYNRIVYNPLGIDFGRYYSSVNRKSITKYMNNI